ncbi:glycoside hydrolase family 28 protein [Pedobacter sp.]|uniref:glycoside hydrolase family 28 protein n=1 Tax=Pedobacter sp. TaxID=1411316 RepID=UPI003D7FE1DE
MKRLIILLCLAITVVSVNAKDYVITKYGVKTDSNKLNTKAIQKVIDKAYSSGGGTIVVPKGVFLTGALFFKAKVNLRLLEGAVLKGSDDIANYPLIPSRMEGKSLPYYAALINAYKVNGFVISGPGTINGNGLRFWKAFWARREEGAKLKQPVTNLEVHRPRLIFIWGSDNVKIEKVKLINSGFWTTHLYQCNNVIIEDCDIRSPYHPVPAPSTDGIDLDVCRNVIIRNCYISVNDDAIAIKGGKGPTAHKEADNGIVEDILIEGCTFGPSHGTVTIGSECIHVKNLVLRNCKVENNTPILRLKIRPDTFQIYEDITVENITGTCGTVISMNPWKQFFNMDGSKEIPFATVRNIKLQNINVTCNQLGEMQGNQNDVVSGIILKDINVTARTPGFNSKYEGISLENVTVNGVALKSTQRN